jgi:hypothetical protein
MTNGVSAEKKEGKKSLKDDAKLSKRHMIAIWAALATALGSQGIPAIVTLLENKPDVEDVQQMIANQTSKLTAQQNTAVEAIKDLHADVKDLQKMSDDVSHVKGCVDVMRDVMRDCCTKRSIRHRLDKPKPAAVHKPDPIRVIVESKSPVEQLQKVPEFDSENMENMIQQRVQIMRARIQEPLK